jgi:hypothetical protein
MDVSERAVRATFVLLVASLGLLGAGLAGTAASLTLAAGLLGIGGVLFTARGRLDAGPEFAGRDPGAYGRLLWAGPVVAAAVCLAFLGATPAELQSLGGLVGLVGMANYFLRPVYRAGSILFERVMGTR